MPHAFFTQNFTVRKVNHSRHTPKGVRGAVSSDKNRKKIIKNNGEIMKTENPTLLTLLELSVEKLSNALQEGGEILEDIQRGHSKNYKKLGEIKLKIELLNIQVTSYRTAFMTTLNDVDDKFVFGLESNKMSEIDEEFIEKYGISSAIDPTDFETWLKIARMLIEK